MRKSLDQLYRPETVAKRTLIRTFVAEGAVAEAYTEDRRILNRPNTYMRSTVDSMLPAPALTRAGLKTMISKAKENNDSGKVF